MIDLQLFKNIIKEGRHNTDLLDSYSPNQFKSKQKLEDAMKDHILAEAKLTGGTQNGPIAAGVKSIITAPCSFTNWLFS